MPLYQNSILEWREVDNLKIRKLLTPKEINVARNFLLLHFHFRHDEIVRKICSETDRETMGL